MIALEFFAALNELMDWAMVILFIHLSVSFSEPLSDEYRSKILLIFKRKDMKWVE